MSADRIDYVKLFDEAGLSADERAVMLNYFQANDAKRLATEGMATSMFVFIAHGDEKHREWLRNATREWFAKFYPVHDAARDAVIADLLSACQQTLDSLEWCLGVDDPRCVAMRAAIQKATT